jgi:hypothetical protein
MPNIHGKICWASAINDGLSANLHPKVSTYGRRPCQLFMVYDTIQSET